MYISEHLAKYGIQMDPSVIKSLKEANNLERRLYCACWGCYPLFSGGGSNWKIAQESAAHRKPEIYRGIAHVAWNKHNWEPVTSTSARGVTRTSMRRLGHLAQAGIFFGRKGLLPSPRCNVLQSLTISYARSLFFPPLCLALYSLLGYTLNYDLKTTILFTPACIFARYIYTYSNIHAAHFLV